MDVFVVVALFGLVAVWLGVVLIGPPYVPTLKRDLELLFDDIKIGASDHVVDLGAGDGRVMAEATKRGATASGIEINPFLVWCARFRLRQQKNTSVALGDMWRYELPPDTTYVFVFFAHAFMKKLERYLVEQKQQGRSFRVVSYGFEFEDRKPERIVGAFNIYLF